MDVAKLVQTSVTRFSCRRLVLAVLLPLSVGGCPAGGPTATGPAFTHEGADLRHVASGMSFPSAVGGFQRVSPHIYDIAGRDVSVGYNLVDGDRSIVATVYVYPAPSLMSFGSPDRVVADARARLARGEFERRKTEVTHAHPGAALLQEEPATLSQTPSSIDGWQATFALTSDFAGQNRALQSELFVFCFVGQAWALEYRFTYPQQLSPRAQIDSFIHDLHVTIPK